MELGPQTDKIPAGMLQRMVAGVVLGLTWKYRSAVSSPGSKDVTAASGEGQNCHPMFSAHNGFERGLGSTFEIIWRPQKSRKNKNLWQRLALVNTSLTGV